MRAVEPVREEGADAPRSRWAERGRRFAADNASLAAAAAFLAVIAFCVFAPILSPHDPNDINFAVNREGPSLAHPLGTDQFGRDLLTRVAIGGRTSLLIAAGALGLIMAIGVAYGTLAAVAGGLVDAAMMRVVDGLFAIPRLPVAIVILVALRLSAQNVAAIVFALSVAGWMLTARLVRGQVLALKTRDYVRAARAAGASWLQVARRHLVPNSAGVILVAVFLELPAVVLGEAFLSVLGLGPEPPTATWGNIAQEGLRFSNVWVMFVASTAIAVFAVSANVLADRIEDALDPRRTRERPRRERRLAWRAAP